MKKIYSFYTLAILAVLTTSFTLLSIKGAKTVAGDLVYQEVATAHSVDGIVDGKMADVMALAVSLGETANPPNDPSKINNCSGCHTNDN